MYGEFAEREFAVLRGIIQPGDFVLDIGANIGTYAIPLAQMVGPSGFVYAFEPQRQVFNILCANIAMSGAYNITAHKNGVGKAPGTARIPLFALDVQENNFGVSVLADEASRGDIVSVIAVDDLHLMRCDFIKIDVEGMEAEVLTGARETIDKFRPVMWVENDKKGKGDALLALINDMDYRAYWHIAPLLPEDMEGRTAAPEYFDNVVSIDMLCFHKTTDANLTGFAEAVPGETWQTAMAKLTGN